jgi:Core-2/I-Branching enzyme
MTVCYFIQSHRDRDQIVRLVRTLRRASPGAPILIGHDASGCALAATDLAGIGGVDLFHYPGPARRGNLSLLAPYFRALDRLAERAAEFDWLVYLSGQDYPLRPLAETEAFLAQSGGDGFLTFDDALAPANSLGRVRRRGIIRYHFQYWILPAKLRPLLRALRFVNRARIVHLHTTFEPRVGVRVFWGPFRRERRCYVGSQWTTLRRGCTDFLAESWHRERELVEYYRRTICPDESLVQTLLVNSGRFTLTNDNLRYANLAGTRDGHPRLLTTADLATLCQGPWHFARKFDAALDSTVLDRLDERIFA